MEKMPSEGPFVCKIFRFDAPISSGTPFGTSTGEDLTRKISASQQMTNAPKAPRPYRLSLGEGKKRTGFELDVAGLESIPGRLISALLTCVSAFVAWIVWVQFSPGSDENSPWVAIHWGFVALLTFPLLLATIAGLKQLLAHELIVLHPDLAGLETILRLGGVTISRKRWPFEDFDHVEFRFLYGGYKSSTRHVISIGGTHTMELTTSRDRSESISFALWLGELTGLPVRGIPEVSSTRLMHKPTPIIRSVQELNVVGTFEDSN